MSNSLIALAATVREARAEISALGLAGGRDLGGDGASFDFSKIKTDPIKPSFSGGSRKAPKKGGGGGKQGLLKHHL